MVIKLWIANVLEVTYLMLLNGLGLLRIVGNQINSVLDSVQQSNCLGIIFRNCCLFRIAIYLG